jgi:hypothetical protein
MANEIHAMLMLAASPKAFDIRVSQNPFKVNDVVLLDLVRRFSYSC